MKELITEIDFKSIAAVLAVGLFEAFNWSAALTVVVGLLAASYNALKIYDWIIARRNRPPKPPKEES